MSVLATKLYIPPVRQKAVPRPRLVERLNAGLQYTPSILLISASAGSGKTTLVSEWVNDLRHRHSPAPRPVQGLASDDLRLEDLNQIENRKSKIRNQVAWLSLDEDDNDPTRFLIYLVSSVQTVLPEMGMELLTALQSPQPPPLETVLTAMLNEISTFPDDLILVLDDYHVIESKPVDQILAFLMEHLPHRMHLVIATREDPQLPLARYRARGQLTELRASDLRFTPVEAAEFLNQVMGLHLSAEEITALENRTEGWIAGLQLAALSMQGQKDTTGFIKSFTGSHRFVLDYLMEEVLQREPETIQTFLLTTSILERLCASLCEAVLCTPSGSGQEILNYLESSNLFIVPLDNERHWYRYHRLFADLLRQRLQQSTEGIINVYHSRASAWFEENGFENEAFQHAIAARDFERAARMAELSWLAMFRSNIQNITFLAWMKALPDELIRARPVLSVGYAWALLDVGEMEAAEARLQDAERWLETAESKPSGEMAVVDEDAFRSLASTISFARAFLSLALGDVASTLKHARQGLASLPEADHFQRASAAALLGAAFWRTGELETACDYMSEGLAEIYKAGNPDFAISGIVGLADIRMTQGRLREAVRLYERTLQTALERGEPIQGTSDLYLGLGMLSIEQNDLETAEQHLHKSQELGAQAGLPDWKYRLSIVQAKVDEIQGNLEGALDLFQEAERLYYRSPLPDVRPVSASRTRIWVKQGRLNEALGWVREKGLSVDEDLSFMREFEHITLARVLIAEFKLDHANRHILEALELLERLLKAAESGGRTGSLIEILILQAIAHQVQGKLPSALAALGRALSLAEPEGYIRIFADEGESLRELLVRLKAQGTGTNAYIQKLLTAFSRPTTIPQSKIENQQSEIPEPLSPRELEVLRLIAEGLSNDEISKRLFLALSTVKGHNLKIFGKLGAKSRTEAVARARELGLL